jgi:hypothetical protein
MERRHPAGSFGNRALYAAVAPLAGKLPAFQLYYTFKFS